MKQTVQLSILTALLALTIGCAGSNQFHKTAMPEPQSFNAHFGDIDADENDWINWKEFEAFFSNAKAEVFKELDLNGDESVDHDEWHQFKEAHGLKHKE